MSVVCVSVFMCDVLVCVCTYPVRMYVSVHTCDVIFCLCTFICAYMCDVGMYVSCMHM